MTITNNIIIYRDHLIPSSETFILDQGEGLKNFTPYYFGSRRIKGLVVPEERTKVLNKNTPLGWIKESIFKYMGWPLHLTTDARKLNPVLIHAHFGVGGALALPLVKSLKIPLIVTFHGFDATVKDEYARQSFLGHRIYIKKRKELQQTAKRFIAVSDFIKGKMIEQGFPEEKIIKHYIGVDTEYFTPDSNVERENIVLFVGRLVKNKGCEYLIRAMGQVQKKYPEIELVIIGDGPLRSQLEELAKQTLKKYRFLGIQPRAVVRSWMNKSKIFSVPSITIETGASEGFGMVFAEAGAMGLPVVSFSTGGIPEAVLDGETGFLVPERDWEGLSAKIQCLFEDNKLWEKFSVKGQNRVRTQFDLKSQIKKLEEIYEQTLLDY